MQKRAVAVIAAASLLGLAAAMLGFTAEYFKHRAFVGSDNISRCEYRRTPALGCGIAAAALSVAAVALVTGASGCFGRCGAAATESGRGCVWRVLAALAWFMTAAAAVMFLYGASWNAGGTRGFTTVSSGRSGSAFGFGCPELRNGVFVAASIKAIIGIVCGITAYADILKRRERTPRLGVEMEQAYPAAPVAYAAAAPQPPPPYGGYGAKY